MTGFATATGGSFVPSFAAALVVVVVAVLVAVATRTQQRVRLARMATPALPCRHCRQIKAARSLTGPAMPTGRKQAERIDAPVQNGGNR